MTLLLQGLLARQAERRPDAAAVVMGDRRLTYEQLALQSNRMARALQDVGCRPGDRVCLLLPKAPATVAAMLAVLKADCAYVPVDLASPPARVGRMIAAAEPAAVLVSPEAAGLVSALLADGSLPAGTPLASPGPPELLPDLELAFAEPALSDFPDGEVASRNRPEDPAHILFTSGSTGVPKGVVVTHASVLAFVHWATDYFGLGADDRISGHPPLHFDLSTFDIFGALAAGAELHLVPPELNLVPHKLAALIEDEQLTQWFCVPSTMAYMSSFDAVPAGGFPALRRVIWCGEVLPTPVLARWMRLLPHVRFTNLYGPTETTIASSYYSLPAPPADESRPIPIGTPCPGEELLVLDDELRPVEPGATGEIYIGGVGLSPGYWRDDEKTAAAFVPDPRSPGARLYRTGDLGHIDGQGLAHFVGRADSQIKSRGYRIELGEIEAALSALGPLRECAVVAVPTGGFEGTAICCAYVSAEDVTPVELRERLRAVLPAYMLPSRWLSLAALPKNVNGKIDRPRLRELFDRQTPDEAAGTLARAAPEE